MNKEKLKEQNRVLFVKRDAIAKAKHHAVKIRSNRPKVVNKVIQLDAPLPRKPSVVAPNTVITTKKAGCSGCSRQIRKAN